MLLIKKVEVCKGKYGVFLKYNKKNINIGNYTEEDLTKEIAEELINKPKFKSNSNQNQNQSKYNGIKINNDISIKTGKFGPYIVNNGKNISLKFSKIFKSLNKKYEELSLEDCNKIIEEFKSKPKK